ncbi:MAG: hypothetical protein QXY10_02840, partial [Candidatus Micrarchaeaceae archaeon]
MKSYGMKLQSALEMLITYSWAIIILTLFIAIAAVISLSSPSSTYMPPTCNIAPTLPCIYSLLTSYSSSHPAMYLVEFSNNFG